jgi:addiction module RelB/DinJ family antitoxin
MDKEIIRLIVRIDKEDKECVELIITELGLTHTDLIRLLYKQVRKHERIPFDIKLPDYISRRYNLSGPQLHGAQLKHEEDPKQKKVEK